MIQLDGRVVLVADARLIMETTIRCLNCTSVDDFASEYSVRLPLEFLLGYRGLFLDL